MRLSIPFAALFCATTITALPTEVSVATLQDRTIAIGSYGTSGGSTSSKNYGSSGSTTAVSASTGYNSNTGKYPGK